MVFLYEDFVTDGSLLSYHIGCNSLSVAASF